MNRNKSSNGMNKIIKSVTIGCIAGSVACTALLALLSLILVKGGILPTDFIALITVIVAGIGAFIGSYIAIRISKSNGLLTGGMTALIMFIATIIIGIASANRITVAETLSKAAVMITSGCIGGVIGVNKKKKR